MTQDSTWWRHAITYEIYVRSFQDSDGDGVGDLEGIRRRLGHVAALGADAIWLTPHYRSPMADHGYDVSDHRSVDPLFGDLAAFDRLVDEAHRQGLRVLIDIVPNHTSDRHPWFQEALTSATSPHRSRYIFAPPAPGGGPPNNWRSVFGGSAWSSGGFGQYYLHLFAPEQPDLNWRHPAVVEEFESIVRFWLERGVDGFRIDVAHGLFKDAELRDNPGPENVMQWNQPESREVFRSWRRIVDAVSSPALLVGEVLLKNPDPRVIATYVGDGILHQAFSFAITAAPFDAASLKTAAQRVLFSLEGTSSAPAWVLSNHDVVRHVTRYGGGDLGRRRASAALLFVLGLPGSVFLYQGEELGAEQVEVPQELRQDPVWSRSRGAQPGRDGARTPMPWTPEPPGFGFTAGTAWLPFAPDAAKRNATAQSEAADSMLAFYRRAIALRRAREEFRDGSIEWTEQGAGVAGYRRSTEHGSVFCLLSSARQPVTLPRRGRLLLGSDSRVRSTRGVLTLPPDTAAWVLDS